MTQSETWERKRIYQNYSNRNKRYYCKAVCWWGIDNDTADFAYTDGGRDKMMTWIDKHLNEGWRVSVHIGKAK